MLSVIKDNQNKHVQILSIAEILLTCLLANPLIFKEDKLRIWLDILSKMIVTNELPKSCLGQIIKKSCIVNKQKLIFH